MSSISDELEAAIAAHKNLPPEAEALEDIAGAIRELTEGESSGPPRGIEGLTMALAGDPQKDESVASAIGRLADAVQRIAEIMERKP